MKLILISLLMFSFGPLQTAFAFDALLGGGSEGGSVPGRTRPRGRPVTGSSNGPCQIRNAECTASGIHVQIDLAAQCMCVGQTCFEVAIGRFGPNQTRNGTGTIGRVSGGRYRTHGDAPLTTGWDNDAVSMGIPQNDRGASSTGANLPVTAGGKWIHKVGMDSNGNCIEPPTRYLTAGCVGVPCHEWDHVRGAMGQSLTVCGGASSDSEIISINGCRNRRHCPRDQRASPHLGCARSVTMARARGHRDVRCLDPATGRIQASPPFPTPPTDVRSDYEQEDQWWRSIN